MSSSDPFAEPDDSDKTVIRPRPGGGVRPPAGAAATAPMASAAASVVLPSIGVNTLVAAASPLLAAAMRVRGRATHPDPDGLRRSMVQAVRDFEKAALATGLDTVSLRAARYAVCATIDDIVLSTPWGANSAWPRETLVSIFHNEVSGGERFFDILGQMEKDLNRHFEVVELMYVCLSLGMEGRYRVLPRGSAQLAELRDGLYRLIRQRRGEFERELSPHWPGIAAVKPSVASRIPAWVLGSVTAALMALVYVVLNFSLAGYTDAAAYDLAGLPPGTPMVIAAANIAPPPPPPPPPPSDTLPRLKKFLEKEIAEGLVRVMEDGQSVTVRVVNRNMFASGDSTLNASYVPLLERIGEALNGEQGNVLVTGHTDNQPIRTARFPSNWHLSQARAESAAKVILTKLKDPARLKAEGKADNEPIAPNTTPQGQQENRRTDIILLKPANPVSTATE